MIMILIVMITILISNKILRPALTALLAFTLVALTACGGEAGGEDELSIVATTSIWGDVVSNIVGEDANVEVVIPTGADAHDFEPTSAQIAAIQAADLVIANGLGLEEAMEDTLEAAVADGANIYEVAPDLGPLPFSGDEHAEDEHDDHADDEEGHDHEGEDPHVWFDLLRVAEAAELIAQRLSEVDDSIDWQERATAYATQLREADTEVVEILAPVPEESRKLVTNHEAFGYFADRYGFEVIGVVVPGGSTLADPSSADLADLVEEIELEGVTTIFAETSQPTRLAEAVAAEAGRDVSVVELYTESVGEPGSGAESLIGMLTTNATRIADALTQ
jgi:zinc/manganese transport system substrate-binding protein